MTKTTTKATTKLLNYLNATLCSNSDINTSPEHHTELHHIQHEQPIPKMNHKLQSRHTPNTQQTPQQISMHT